jgi:hypothetical protein
MGTRFIPNPGFRRELEAGPEFTSGMKRITVTVAEEIKLAAEPFRDTGHYIKSVKARKNRVHLEPHFAHLAEYGSVHNPPQANARRGVKAAGLRFADDGPKQAD